ncbi:hypothetical protein HNO81_14845 [Pseudarthrobacter sp. C4D7]|nr:hypothetical protein [Pseudarthrobacter sp. C4D7]
MAKSVLKRLDQSGGRLFYGGMIALMLGLFAWLTRGRIVEAAPFLAAAVVYGVLLYRVVSVSVRAFTVMSWAHLAIFYALTSLDVAGKVGIPASGPWFIGFIIGGIAGGYTWSGPRAGTEFRQAKRRKPEADGSFGGSGWLAVVNGLCALALLGFGTATVMLLSPTAAATATALTLLFGAFAAGWALFRFSLPVTVRSWLLLGIPVGLFVLLFVGGAMEQMALPHAWVIGVLAGILTGGRYWTGDRLGAPRPPFAVRGRRRQRKRRRPAQAHGRTARAEVPAGK